MRVPADGSVPALRPQNETDSGSAALACRKSLRCDKDAGKESESLSSSRRNRSAWDFRTARPRDAFLVECRDNHRNRSSTHYSGRQGLTISDRMGNLTTCMRRLIQWSVLLSGL